MTSRITRKDYLKGTAGGILSLALLSKFGISTQAAPVTDNLHSDSPNSGGGSTVEWNQLQDSGDKIAEVTIDGMKTYVYAPARGSGSGSEILYHQERMPTNSKTYTINFDKKPSSWIRISSLGQAENNHNYAWFLVGDPACNFLWSNGSLSSNRKATLTWAEDMMSVTVVGQLDASGCSNYGTTVPMMLDYYVRDGE